MHIINECPRCNKDFMYHTTDTYLSRDITIVDEVGNNEIIEVVICQDCHLTEKWVGKEVKVKEDKYDTHLNKYKLTVESIVLGERYPITVQIGDVDSYDWFDEDELEIVDTEIANIAAFIEEKAEHRGWENAEYMAADKLGEEKTLQAIQYLDRLDAELQEQFKNVQ